MPEMCTYCVGSRNQGDKYGDDYQDEYSRSLKEWCVDTGASRHVCCIVVGSSHIRWLRMTRKYWWRFLYYWDLGVVDVQLVFTSEYIVLLKNVEHIF